MINCFFSLFLGIELDYIGWRKDVIEHPWIYASVDNTGFFSSLSLAIDKRKKANAFFSAEEEEEEDLVSISSVKR